MNNDPVQRAAAESGADTGGDTLHSVWREFYSRPLRSIVIATWGFGGLFFALAALGAVQFFRADQTKAQIMYATLVILGAQGIGLMKIFAWEMVHRHNLKREIQRLQRHVSELSRDLQAKQP